MATSFNHSGKDLRRIASTKYPDLVYHQLQTVLRVIILRKHHSTQYKELVTALQGLGIATCYMVSSIQKARELQLRTSAVCILFERKYTVALKDFFNLFTANNVWFIPITHTLDYLDVVDALNSHKTCYYLVAPLTEEKLAIAMRCLREYLFENT